MVLAAEASADFRKRGAGELLAHIHRHLARHGHRFGVVAGFELGELQLIVLADELLDAVDRDRSIVVRQHVAKRFLCQLEGDLLAGQRGIRDEPDERSLQLAHV